MIPSLVALPSAGTGQQPTSDLAAGRAPRPDAPPRTDTRSKTETARAVEPPRPASLSSSSAPVERRNLNPPDPKAPAGPPPAFEASILDRQREEALKPPQPDLAGPPATSFAHPAASEAKATSSTAAETPAIADEEVTMSGREGPTAIREPLDDKRIGAAREDPVSERRDAGSHRAAYDVPPSAEARAEQEVATIRRIETPYDIVTVDVSR
jgi:hypothetical protein